MPGGHLFTDESLIQTMTHASTEERWLSLDEVSRKAGCRGWRTIDGDRDLYGAGLYSPQNVSAGSLARIAAALESIAISLDPDLAAKRKAERDADAIETEKHRRWMRKHGQLVKATDALVEGWRKQTPFRLPSDEACALEYKLRSASPWVEWVNSDSEDPMPSLDAVHPPERIARDGSKRQARYAEWLAAFNASKGAQ